MPKKEEIVMISRDYIGGFKDEEQEPRKLTSYQKLRLQHQLTQDNHYLMNRGLKFGCRVTVPMVSRMQIKRASTAFRNLAKQLDIVLSNKNKIDKMLFNCADSIIKKNNLQNFVTYKRAYASGYTHGTIHDLHRDDGADQNNKIFTIMFYLNKIWNVT